MDIRIVNLRALAIITVVFGHIIILYDPEWQNYEHYYSLYQSPTLMFVKKLINSFQMELFIGISGYCAAFTIHKYQFIEYCKNKIFRLIRPFVIVGLFLLIPIRLILNFPLYEDLNIWNILYNLFSLKDAGHLWFLPVLYAISVISFFNKTYSSSKYFISLGIGLSFFILSSLFSNIFIQRTFHYFIFYIIGYYLNVIEHTNHKSLKYYYFISLFLISLILFFYSFPIGKTFLTSLLICGVLYLIIPPKQFKFIEFISKKKFYYLFIACPITAIWI